MTLDIGAFGAHIAVTLRGLDETELATIRDLWARCPPQRGDRTASLSAGIHSAYSGADGAADAELVAPDFFALQQRLSSAVTLTLLHLVRDQYLLLHACALAHPATGATVALVGASGSGKTTAAAVLAKRLGYVTDETVAVDGELTVHSYPKPLSVALDGGVAKWQRSPDDLGLLTAEPPLRLAAVVMLDRSDDAPETPRLEPLDPAEAITRLVPQVSYLAERERPLAQLTEVIAHVGGVRRISYRDASDLAEPLTRLLEVPPSNIENEWMPAETASAATSGVRRVEVHDAVSNGEQVIVLHDSEVHVLDGIAPAIWDAADGASVDELTDAVIARFGEPPGGGARGLVLAAVAELERSGLITGGPRDA